MGSSVNIDKLCRICTVEQSDGVFIFSDVGKKLCLEAKLKKYLYLTVTSEDNLPKLLCLNCCKKLDGIHKFASMAYKMQDKLKMLIAASSMEDGKEHSILHSILSKAPDSDCEVTEVEVRVDPMLFLCALEDGSSDGEDNSSSIPGTSEEQSESIMKMDSTEDTSTLCNVKASLPTPPPPPRLPPATTIITTSAVTTAASTKTIAAPVVSIVTSPMNMQSAPQHLEKESKPYCCSVCSRGFYNEIGLQNHLWSHLPQDRRILGNTVANNVEREIVQGNGALETMISERGSVLVIDDGYKYRFHKRLSDGVQRWCCTMSSCKSFIKIEGGKIVEKVYRHAHEKPSEETLKRQKLSNNLKRKAINDISLRSSELINREMKKSNIQTLNSKDMALLKRNIKNARLSHSPKLSKGFREPQGGLL